MQELSDSTPSSSAHAMEEPSSGSEAPSEASEVRSEATEGYNTSGDDSDEEQVAGCESCGESDYEDALSEADDDASADSDAARDIEHAQTNDAGPACSMCFVPLDLSKLVTAKDGEVLTCDGSCGRDVPWQELRFHCVTDCDLTCALRVLESSGASDSSPSQHHHRLAHHRRLSHPRLSSHGRLSRHRLCRRPLSRNSRPRGTVFRDHSFRRLWPVACCRGCRGLSHAVVACRIT